MIIIKTKNKIKSFSQNYYDSIINPQNLRRILKDTPFEDFTVHGYYERRLFCFAMLSIVVMRIKVANKTHTVLLEPMIPYSPFLFHDVYQICVHDNIPDHLDISDFVLFYIKRCFTPTLSFGFEFLVLNHIPSMLLCIFLSYD